MSAIIRASRSYSSEFEYSTSRYSSADRVRESATCVCVIRLPMGVRSSCARSDENSDRRRNDSSRRDSMPLNAAARSTSSIGKDAVGSRSCSRLAVMLCATLVISRTGARPRLAASQPSSAVQTIPAAIASQSIS